MLRRDPKHATAADMLGGSSLMMSQGKLGGRPSSGLLPSPPHSKPIVPPPSYTPSTAQSHATATTARPTSLPAAHPTHTPMHMLPFTSQPDEQGGIGLFIHSAHTLHAPQQPNAHPHRRRPHVTASTHSHPLNHSQSPVKIPSQLCAPSALPGSTTPSHDLNDVGPPDATTTATTLSRTPSGLASCRVPKSATATNTATGALQAASSQQPAPKPTNPATSCQQPSPQPCLDAGSSLKSNNLPPSSTAHAHQAKQDYEHRSLPHAIPAAEHIPTPTYAHTHTHVHGPVPALLAPASTVHGLSDSKNDHAPPSAPSLVAQGQLWRDGLRSDSKPNWPLHRPHRPGTSHHPPDSFTGPVAPRNPHPPDQTPLEQQQQQQQPAVGPSVESNARCGLIGCAGSTASTSLASPTSQEPSPSPSAVDGKTLRAGSSVNCASSASTSAPPNSACSPSSPPHPTPLPPPTKRSQTPVPPSSQSPLASSQSPTSRTSASQLAPNTRPLSPPPQHKPPLPPPPATPQAPAPLSPPSLPADSDPFPPATPTRRTRPTNAFTIIFKPPPPPCSRTYDNPIEVSPRSSSARPTTPAPAPKQNHHSDSHHPPAPLTISIPPELDSDVEQDDPGPCTTRVEEELFRLRSIAAHEDDDQSRGSRSPSPSRMSRVAHEVMQMTLAVKYMEARVAPQFLDRFLHTPGSPSKTPVGSSHSDFGRMERETRLRLRNVPNPQFGEEHPDALTTSIPKTPGTPGHPTLLTGQKGQRRMSCDVMYGAKGSPSAGGAAAGRGGYNGPQMVQMGRLRASYPGEGGPSGWVGAQLVVSSSGTGAAASGGRNGFGNPGSPEKQGGPGHQSNVREARVEGSFVGVGGKANGGWSWGLGTRGGGEAAQAERKLNARRSLDCDEKGTARGDVEKSGGSMPGGLFGGLRGSLNEEQPTAAVARSRSVLPTVGGPKSRRSSVMF